MSPLRSQGSKQYFEWHFSSIFDVSLVEYLVALIDPKQYRDSQRLPAERSVLD